MKKTLLLLLLATLQESQGVKYVYGPDELGKAALVDLRADGPPTSCSLNLPPLPIPELSKTSTAFIKGRLTVCGGSRPGYVSPYCFALDENRKWVNFPSLPGPLSLQTSHMLDNNTWWLSGGGKNSGVSYNIQTGVWKNGPNIPIHSYGHCIVGLDDGRTMLLAGWKKIPVIKPIYNKQVYILENGNWVLQQGELNRAYKRFGFSQVCARTKDGGVMILGGKPSGKDHVEVWNSEFGFWSTGDASMRLPVGHVWYPSSALDGDGNIYVIGGESPKGDEYSMVSDRILKWDGAAWTVHEGALPFPMTYSPIAKLNSDTDLSC